MRKKVEMLKLSCNTNGNIILFRDGGRAQLIRIVHYDVGYYSIDFIRVFIM